MWVRFRNECRPYDGPPLAYLVTACTAPDGSYWALQSWQRNLPHRGWTAWTAWQSAWELRLSHWSGPVAHVELFTDWAFGGQAHDIFGRMTYDGSPVHGFHSTSNGAPTDAYGRGLYIDTFDSAYGAGLEARDVGRLPQADRSVLLLVLADARRVAARQAVAAGGRRHEVPHQRGRSRGDAGCRRRRARPRPLRGPGRAEAGRAVHAGDRGRQVLLDAALGPAA